MTTTAPRYGKYLLVLSGSVEHAPFLKNWKTLKDSMRKIAGDPGWTDVSPISHNGIRRGWCNLSIEGKAKAAYSTRHHPQIEEQTFTSSALGYYSKMPGVGVCLMKRTLNGEYLLLNFPAASQCSHNPWGRQENCQRLIPNRVLLPCNATFPFVSHHMMQPRGYSFLPLQFYPLYVAGVHLPTLASGFVNRPLPLS